MLFSEKLNYLFNLTNSEGKELAAVMHLTPPQISKMRNGKRGLPRNKDDARVLARFFAKRINNEFMLEELAKTLHLSRIRNITDETQLMNFLLDWLNDDNIDEYAAKRASNFLSHFDSLINIYDKQNKSMLQNDLSTEQSRFFVYYGSEGKRLAVIDFLTYLFQLKQEFRIDILTDEDISWVTEDPSYSDTLQKHMVNLTDHGCTFRRIAEQITDIDQAFESLNRWLPLYMTGKATSYYYRRMRDNLNRITLFVVPNVCALFSFSVAKQNHINATTFFTLDKKTIEYMSQQFETYLSFCDPIMNVYNTLNNSKQLYEMLLDYQMSPFDSMQKINSLSFITLPWEIAKGLETTGNLTNKDEFLTLLAKRHKIFIENIENNRFLDFLHLATIDEVINKKVLIPATYILSKEPQYYQPLQYISHLKTILYLLKNYPNYHVINHHSSSNDSTVICIKENFCVLLVKNIYPFMAFKVSEKYLVDAFSEFAYRNIPNDLIKNKITMINTITELIKNIEDKLK